MRNGFVPAPRQSMFDRLAGLQADDCPFANLPEPRQGRWGEGLTAFEMAECRWLKPALVGQFEFVEWTPDNHLRHSNFVALRDDKKRRLCAANPRMPPADRMAQRQVWRSDA